MRFSGYNQRNFRIDKGITMAKTACALHILVDNEMVPAFDKAVFSIPLLKPYGPVKTQFGYHIIKVLYRN